jgi:CubicO group peptidase (beta-lactamase class C family)
MVLSSGRRPSTSDIGRDRRLRRPRVGRLGVVVAGLVALLVMSGTVLAQSDDATPGPGADPAAIMAVAQDVMDEHDLRAVIVRVTVDAEEVVTDALGESMTGVPATPDMHFRNGAVAISYVATVALQLAEEGVFGLDDTIDRWLPDLPLADEVTVRMLLDMTSGYPDYVEDEGFLVALEDDPFRAWTPEELIAIGMAGTRVFEPGTNWMYAHTNYVILGRLLEAATGRPMVELVQERVLDPLGLANTTDPGSAAITEPVLHAFTSERRDHLGVPSGTRFYEESSFWDPSWTITHGAIQTSDIRDLTTTAAAIGEGTLLSDASHEAQVSDHLIGFGSTVEGCRTCHTLDERYAYGLGVVLSGSWILQNPAFSGYAAVAAYLPSERISIAVATTFAEGAFDPETGDLLHGNSADQVFRRIGALVAPGDPPPS